MSPVKTKLHPELRLRPPTIDDVPSSTESSSEDSSSVDGRHQKDKFTERTPGPARAHSVQRQTPMELPLSAQILILRELLVYKDKTIHAISRLDPELPLDEVHINACGQISLLHRFHIGRKSVSLTYALDPQSLLAPLRVCRAWNFLGCHFFYGENTFAFSSLGE